MGKGGGGLARRAVNISWEISRWWWYGFKKSRRSLVTRLIRCVVLHTNSIGIHSIIRYTDGSLCGGRAIGFNCNDRDCQYRDELFRYFFSKFH